MHLHQLEEIRPELLVEGSDVGDQEEEAVEEVVVTGEATEEEEALVSCSALSHISPFVILGILYFGQLCTCLFLLTLCLLR